MEHRLGDADVEVQRRDEVKISSLLLQTSALFRLS